MKIRLLTFFLFSIVNSILAQNNLPSTFFEQGISDIEKIEILIDSSNSNMRVDSTKGIFYAQEALKFAKKANADKQIMLTYFQFGEVYRFNLDNKQARSYYNKAIEYGKKLNEQAQLAIFYQYKGHTFATEGSFKEAIEAHKLRKDIAISLKDTALLGDSFLDIGVTYARKGELYVAVEFFYKCLSLYEAINDTRYTLQLTNNIGAIHQDNKQYDKALIYFEKVKKYIQEKEKAPDATFLATLYINIAITYKNLEQYPEAFENVNEALKQAQSVNSSELIARAEMTLGELYWRQNNLKEALTYSKKAATFYRKENFKDELSSSLLQLASANRSAKKYSTALKYANEAFLIHKEIDQLTGLVNSSKELSTIHDNLGNKGSALNYLQLYIELNDSLFDMNKAEEFIQLEAKYNYEQEELLLNSEINLLRKDKVLQQSRQTVLVLVLISILIALIALFWVFNNNKKKTVLLEKDLENKALIEKQANQLKIFNNQLEETVTQRTAELEQANYELRTFNYIASHDIKEPIRVIGGYAGLIYRRLPTDLKASLGEYFDTIKRSTGQLYNLIEDFANYNSMSKNKSIEKQEVDLTFSVSSVLDNIHESIEKYNGQVIYSDLPIIQSNNFLLFTTLRNLIENGLKYNKSKQAIVEVKYNKTETSHEIIISDNGIGINKEYHEKIFGMFKRLHSRGTYDDGSGIGLAVVKLCVDKLEGSILIDSEEGKGSVFTIQLPL